MQLTGSQKTTLKTHMSSNTNLVLSSSGTQSPINTQISPPFNGDVLQRVADWYNGTALSGDNQAPANLMLWNPRTTVPQLNSAVNWPDNPTGANDTQINNSWMKWQSMTWNQSLGIDMTDPQVRTGVINVWGSGSVTASNIGVATGTLSGKTAGRRVELALAGGVVGAVTGTWTGAHVCPLNVFGAILSEGDVEDLLVVG